ncbi:MAG: sensor domain-containing protein [Chloroflexia bacterium]|nr:sensor domain-containing protein [Chloroflexia bacterium]
MALPLRPRPHRRRRRIRNPPIPPIVGPTIASGPFLRRASAYFFSPVTWTILAYLLLRFPLGVLGFSLATGAIALIAWLAALPVAFVTGATYGVGAAVGALLGPPLAVALFPISLHGLNLLTTRLGALAFAMLGTSDTAQKLQETEARVERQEVKAERAEQSRRELIVNVSHELRTPAASIRGHVESLLLAVDGVR